MTPRPKQLRLRVYQMGFGDCLLLSVTYGSRFADGRDVRHMLIDFGSKEQRDGGPAMGEVAKVIAEHCAPQLDVVVATHRHQDHVKGFGDKVASEVLDTLHPRLVVRPWTDVPETTDPGDVHFAAWQGLDEDSRRFALLLEGVHTQAAHVEEVFALDGTAIAKRAKELASLGIKNAKAVATLEGWGTAPDGDAVWVRADDEVDLGDAMPGVTVRVLGPPTLEQVPEMTSYAKVSEEYWLALADAAALAPLTQPGSAAWLLRELRGQDRSQVLDIVEGFDDVLNNTSLILHVTVGKRSLLFAGDAQAENWSYALDHAYGHNDRTPNPKLRDQLAGVEIYKVGHHGSRNATPMRLYRLWEKRDPVADPVISVLTTMHGVYDSSHEGSVPKAELIDGLALLGPIHSTEDLPDDVWWFDLESAAKGPANFIHTLGDPLT